MTNDEIRIAVAELCGKGDEIAKFVDYELAQKQFQCAEISVDEFYRRYLRVEPKPEIPNYPEDLNACAEFEAGLGDQSDRYLVELNNVIEKWRRAWKPSECNPWVLCTATARQRCEAFLRVHGKWRDA